MAPTDTNPYRVAVVRVRLHTDAARTLLIELLEVGRDGSDRVLGSADDIAGGCSVLATWLAEIQEQR